MDEEKATEVARITILLSAFCSLLFTVLLVGLLVWAVVNGLEALVSWLVMHA